MTTQTHTSEQQEPGALRAPAIPIVKTMANNNKRNKTGNRGKEGTGKISFVKIANCLILEILGLGKNSRFIQQYLVFGKY